MTNTIEPRLFIVDFENKKIHRIPLTVARLVDNPLFVKHSAPLGYSSVLRGNIQRLFGSIDYVDLTLDDLYQSYNHDSNPLLLVDATLKNTKNLSLQDKLNESLYSTPPF